MAQVTGTYDTYAVVGQREDLTDDIINVDPDDTPFQSMIAGRATAKAVRHEWQTDALRAAATTNARIEGDEVTFSAPTVSCPLQGVRQVRPTPRPSNLPGWPGTSTTRPTMLALKGP